jgi:cyclopropane fatty-acyl-phospholipid synthase-like methyltransferase
MALNAPSVNWENIQQMPGNNQKKHVKNVQQEVFQGLTLPKRPAQIARKGMHCKEMRNCRVESVTHVLLECTLKLWANKLAQHAH